MKNAVCTNMDYMHWISILENNPGFFLQEAGQVQMVWPQIPVDILPLLRAHALVLMERFLEAEEQIVQLLSQAIIAADYFLLVNANLLLARTYAQRKEVYKVLDCFRVAEEYAKASGDPELVAKVAYTTAMYYSARGEFSRAQSYLKQAVKLLSNSADLGLRLRCRQGLVEIYIRLERYREALAELQRALKISREAGIRAAEVELLNESAKIHTQIRNHPEAEKELLQVLELIPAGEQQMSRLKTLFNLASLYLQIPRPQDALQRLDECLSLSQAMGFAADSFLCDLYNNYSVAYGTLRDYEKALEYLDRAELIAQKLNTLDQLEIGLNRAKMLIAYEKTAEAEILLKHLEIEFGKRKLSDHQMIALEILASFYRQQGKLAACVRVHEKLELKLKHKLKKALQAQTQNLSPEPSEPQNGNGAGHGEPASPRLNHLKGSVFEFVGSGEAYRRVVNAVMLAAQHPTANVLISGESGTGKEILAHMIHNNSIRRYHPFVAVNAAAIAPNLFEREFFGNLKGAYTGADSTKKGFFMQAHKGSLFLDEITEMPLEFQSKLLRALESRSLIPVGGSEELHFDCRVISSTNRDIYEATSNQHFRLDLLHRINTVEIVIPPLRERQEDIPVLVEHFVQFFCSFSGQSRPKIDASFYKKLSQYSFPGNARELRNIIERLFILSEDRVWDGMLLQDISRIGVKESDSLHLVETVKLSESEQIVKALIKSGGNQSKAAALLNISDATLTRRVVKYELQNYTRKGRNR